MRAARPRPTTTVVDSQARYTDLAGTLCPSPSTANHVPAATAKEINQTFHPVGVLGCAERLESARTGSEHSGLICRVTRVRPWSATLRPVERRWRHRGPLRTPATGWHDCGLSHHHRLEILGDRVVVVWWERGLVLHQFDPLAHIWVGTLLVSVVVDGIEVSDGTLPKNALENNSASACRRSVSA